MRIGMNVAGNAMARLLKKALPRSALVIASR
jgi:hypothetical protein